MKIVILAIDGLEYNLVTKWDLKGFKQEVFGKHDVKVAVKKNEPLYTPLLWASFLLGEPSYKYGLDMHSIITHRDAEAYGPLRYLFLLKYKVLGKRSLGVKNLLKKLGLYNIEKAKRMAQKYEVLPPYAKEKTFVDELERNGKKVYVKEFPGYNDTSYSQERLILTEFLNKPLKRKLEKIRELENLAIQGLEELVKKIDEYDILLYYTPVIDVSHHWLYRPGNIKTMFFLKKVYRDLSTKISEITENSLKESFVLIVSDHGYDPKIHEHSEYGFWSFSKDIGFRPTTILEFKKIIMKVAQL